MSEPIATVPVSGRITESDFRFLMEYPIAGKVTASEKLRYVVSFFGAYHRSLESYEDNLQELNRLLEPARKSIKRAERTADVGSAFVDRLTQLLPQAMAHLVTARVPAEAGKQLSALLELEARLFKMVEALLDSVLRLSVTAHSPTYNPNLLRQSSASTEELVELLRSRNPKPTKEEQK